ncbi:hypothetical protein MRX96_005432 [Rhipicephalus microplus]
MTHEFAAQTYGDLSGTTQVFTDGSIQRDGSATATCIAPQLGTAQQCRLQYSASSTAAQLVGHLLATDLLRESPAVMSAAIICDSKSALSQLVREEHGPLLAQRAERSLLALQERSRDLVLQCFSLHVGNSKNETADELGKRAYSAKASNSFDSPCNNLTGS